MIRDGIRRALSLYRRDRWEREVEDEIKLHLSLRAEQLAAQGMSPKDAYDEAVRRFGPLDESRARLVNTARHREQRMQRTEFLADLKQDFAFAFRTLARQKAWTAVTICTLALGIGATTAVFSVVSTLLLHAVPYPDADRVVTIYQQPTTGNNTGISVTIAPATQVISAWRANSRSLEAIVAGRTGGKSLRTTTGEPSIVNTAEVDPSFPEFAGVRPIIGRTFTDADIASGASVVLLGEGFWRERLAANPNVLGQSLTANDSSYVVIGVMPASLRFDRAGSRATDLWLPFDLRDKRNGGSAMGRLRPGVTAEVAARELDSIFARTSGFTSGPLPFHAVVAAPSEGVTFRSSLLLLMGAVGLVLLVACANVAHLFLARTAARTRELSIRTALGAGGSRILRQLLTESALLAAAGTVLGIFVGWVGLRVLVALPPSSMIELKAAHVDTTTLLVTIGVCVASAFVFGGLGAFQSSRHSTNESLKSSGGGLSRASRGRGRALLVVSEMALSIMLIVGATLVVRSLRTLQRRDLGFEAAGLYSLYATLPPALRTPAARQQFVAQLSDRAARMPGVSSVAAAQALPGSRSFSVGRLEVDGETPPPATSTQFVDVNRISTSYFRTMRLSLVEGAGFTDTSARSNQVIVNEGFARKHWPQNAVGKRIRIAQGGKEPWLTIVGVSKNALTSGPMSESSAPMLYLPPSPEQTTALLVRTTGDARSIAPLEKIARDLGARRLVIESVETRVANSIAEPRFVMRLMTGFSALALILSSIGLYGVLAFSVSQESREIGIRVALGARRSDVVRRVVSRGAGLAAVGAAIGLVGAVWGTRLVASQLYGVERLDTVSFAISAVVLILAALIACVVPTRRALSVDPMTAIRTD
jgi:predicted permease